MNLQMFSVKAKKGSVCPMSASTTYGNGFAKRSSGAASLLLRRARDWASAEAALKG